MCCKVKVKHLKVGDMVDLEGDVFADPDHDHVSLEFELATVEGIDQETAHCIVIYFNGIAVGFPPDHEVDCHT